MSDSKRIGAKIVIDGEKEFRQALTEAKTATTQFKSELAKLSTEFKDNEKSVEALRKKQEAYKQEQASLEKATKLISDRIEQANVVRKKEAESLEKNKKDLAELNAELEKAKTEYGENSEEVKNLTEKISESEKGIKQQESALVKLDTQINKYNTELNKTEAELIEVSRELDTTEKELDQAEKGFKSGAGAIELFKNASNVAGERIKELDKSFKNFVLMTASNLASDAIRGIVSGLKDMATSAIQTGAQFETSMSTVAATMALTESEIATASGRYKILEDSAREMGAATKYSAAEAADALNYLALAGYEAEEAAEALPVVLNLAAAGAMDLGYASDLVTDSMSALGLSMDKLSGFTDEMATTAQKSNTNISQLGEAILVVGGTAKQLAGGTVELNTALGILADNGIKGAEGGTALRNVLKNLLTPTDKAAGTMHELGVNAYYSNGQIKPLNETFKDLASKLDGLSDKERNEVLNRIFDTRTLKSAEALLANCGERFDELSGYISDCEGAASMMAYTMSNNLEGKVKTFNSAAQELGITLYQRVQTPLKNAVQAGTEGINTLTNSINNGELGNSLDKLGDTIEGLAEKGVEIATNALPKLIDGAAWLIDNIDGVVIGVKTLVTAYISYEATTKAVTLATELFGVALNANPIGLAVTAVAGLVVAMTSLANVTGKATSEAEKQAKALSSANDSMMNSVQSGGEFVTELQNQKKYTSELITELGKLNDKEELNANEKRRVKEIIGILNSTYPSLNFAIDESTGKTEENTAAIRKNVEELQNQIAVQAMQEKLAEIYEANADAAYEQWKAEQELASVESELNEIQGLLSDGARAYNQSIKDNKDALGEEALSAHELIEKERELNEEKAALTETINQYTASAEEAKNQTEDLKRYMEDELGVTELTESSLNSAADATDNLTGSMDDLNDATGETIEGLNELIQELSDSLEGSLKSASDVFSEFKTAETQNIGEMRKNIDDHIKGVGEWRDSYMQLEDRVGASSYNVLNYLASMGVEGKGYIDEMLTLDDKELKMFVEQMEEALTLPKEVENEIVSKYTDLATNITDTLSDTVEDGASAGGVIDTATRTVGETLNDSLKDELKINGNKSEVMADIGEAATTSLATGITDNKEKVSTATKTVTTEVSNISKTELSSDKFTETGRQVSAGLAAGIRSGESEVVNATKSVCTAAINAANSTMKINSPSKVFEEIGAYTGEGFIVGFDSKANAMVDTVNSTMKSVIPQPVSSQATPVIGDSGEIISILEEYLPYLAQTISLNQFVNAVAPQMDLTMGKWAQRRNTR